MDPPVLCVVLSTQRRGNVLTCRKSNLIWVQTPPSPNVKYALQAHDPEQHYRADETSREKWYPEDVRPRARDAPAGRYRRRHIVCLSRRKKGVALDRVLRSEGVNSAVAAR